jgi:MerR family transcriptional regulator, thiopeptide resistance regulator
MQIEVMTMMKRTYLVGEFAALAGVTVRTLHHYDETGLLKPSQHTRAKHRLYREEDLLRLQQILTFKQLGFSLEEIHDLLENDTYDLRETLRIQKQALDQRIAQLQHVSNTLGVLMQSETMDAELVSQVIHALHEGEKFRWVQAYYTDEQQAWLAERAKDYPPEQMLADVQAWQQIYEDFRANMHKPYDHPDVQAIAARMQGLLDRFTQGNAGVIDSLRNAYQHMEQMPVEQRPIQDKALWDFAQCACEIYRERKTK